MMTDLIRDEMIDDARAEAQCWKAEADTLRGIVLDALAEFEACDDQDVRGPEHWTRRARAAFGID
jgi:hypothetical protein